MGSVNDGRPLRGSTQGLPSGSTNLGRITVPSTSAITSLAPACTRRCMRWAVCTARRVPASGTSWVCSAASASGRSKTGAGDLVAALGILAAYFEHGEARRAS
jgi:hypothetical protein